MAKTLADSTEAQISLRVNHPDTGKTDSPTHAFSYVGSLLKALTTPPNRMSPEVETCVTIAYVLRTVGRELLPACEQTPFDYEVQPNFPSQFLEELLQSPKLVRTTES